MTRDIALAHGLTSEEYDKIVSLIGRTPNMTEISIFSVMWSEHCSYKSSKIWLKTLPTQAPWVICGPGENAGVIDVGDNQAAIFKIESHNHPSFIEPYQGAATGVGGILRDVFTMGARPVALLNALRFGAMDHPKTQSLVQGVVAGISGYGNCMGIPNIGGECEFDPAYNGNILVNAMTIGIADQDKIFYARAAGVGNAVVYVGAKTGRDGIHGATMASAEFSEGDEDQRPTVQVGDPFTEKKLLEACLELMQQDAIVAIQDMGAAGLTSSSIEMASKGDVGLDLNLDHVPCREDGMSAYEMMLSESQERMLMVLRPEKIDLAQRIFKKWELDCTVIGTITDTQRLVITHRGVVEVDVPLSCLADTAPEYNRPWVAAPVRPVFFSENETLSHDTVASMTNALLNHPNIQSKAWIWEQYDSTVMGDTLATPGGDAGIVRIHGTQKALAATTDCTPRYCYADPVLGGTLAVVQAYRNLSAVGAQPLAITNNLNFGNPQKPDIMGQLVGCVQGMGQACRALDFPVISGNVSLYNETDGRAILPTPVIGGVGVLTDYRLRIASFVQDAGLSLVLLGTQGAGWLGCTLWQQVCTTDTTVYAPPPVDLAAEKHLSQAIKTLAQNSLIRACHDVGEGGLLIALTEMLGNHPALGMDLTIPTTAGILFGEDMGRYIVATHDETALHQALGNVPHIILGDVTQGPAWTLNGTALFPDGPQRKPLTF